MKTTVKSGHELGLKSAEKSIAIHVPKNADRPEVFLVRADGREDKTPDLNAGHVKVVHSPSGFIKIRNAGFCDLDIEIPAPAISAGKNDPDI